MNISCIYLTHKTKNISKYYTSKQAFCDYIHTYCLFLLQNVTLITITCGHRFSISAAASLTILTPSSLLDIEHARLATCGIQLYFFNKKKIFGILIYLNLQLVNFTFFILIQMRFYFSPCTTKTSYADLERTGTQLSKKLKKNCPNQTVPVTVKICCLDCPIPLPSCIYIF